MKLLLLVLALTGLAPAASISVDAAAIAQAFRHPSATTLRRVGMGVAVALNSADWGLTAQFTVPGGGQCEANHLLRAPGEPCFVSRPRLDVAKLTINIALIGEEFGHQFMQHKAENSSTATDQVKWLNRDRNLEVLEAIGNAAVSLDYGIVTARNVSLLSRQR